MRAIILFSLLINIGCQSQSSTEIRIGEFLSMTGNEATYGISTHRAVQMAVDEVNKSGGINGKSIRLINLDDQGTAEEAVAAVKKLITQEKVHLLIGEVASSRSLAAAPIAQRYKVPMVTPSSTNPKVTEIGDYIFRTCFTDPFQGKVLAKFAVENLKAKTAAIIIDRKSDYSIGLADYFKNTFVSLGGSISATQFYMTGDFDFKAQLTAIKNTGADVVMVPGYYSEVGLIIRQAKHLKLKSIFLGGGGWDSPRLSEIAGDAIDGNYFSTHYSVEDKDPRVVEFVKSYKEKYGVVPDGIAAMGYDAAKVAIDALKRTKSLAGNDIREALASTKNFASVTGVITIDEKRDALMPAVVLKIENKSYHFAKRVEP